MREHRPTKRSQYGTNHHQAGRRLYNEFNSLNVVKALLFGASSSELVKWKGMLLLSLVSGRGRDRDGIV